MARVSSSLRVAMGGPGGLPDAISAGLTRIVAENRLAAACAGRSSSIRSRGTDARLARRHNSASMPARAAAFSPYWDDRHGFQPRRLPRRRIQGLPEGLD